MMNTMGKSLCKKINAFLGAATLFVFCLLLAVPSKSFAAIGGPLLSNCGVGGDGPKDPKGKEILCVVGNVKTWVLGIVGGIIVLMIIIAGIRYITSAGNAAQAEGAKKTLVGAIIGLIIVVLSEVIIQLVINIMSGTF